MDLTDTQWTAIERACRAQARRDRELAELADRPIARNQRMDSAQELLQIADQIAADRRGRATAGPLAGGDG